MFRVLTTASVVALAAGLMFGGVASAQEPPTGPDSQACFTAKAAVDAAGDDVEEAENLTVGTGPDDVTQEAKDQAVTNAKNALRVAELDRDAKCAEPAPSTTPAPTSTVAPPPDLDEDRRRFESRECFEARRTQQIDLDELNASIERLNQVRLDAEKAESPGGAVITTEERERILAASRIENDRQEDLRDSVERRKDVCRDDGGNTRTTVTVVPPPPGIFYGTPNQVSRVPQGGIETGGGH